MNQAGNPSLQGRLRVRIRIRKSRDALFTLLVFAAPGAFGQNSASLGGTIQDSTGAVVPKATVRLTSHEQGTVRSAESNQTGLYSFTFLPRGVYDMEVTATGFRTLSDKNITLATAESVRRDYTVEVGNVSDNVTISAEAQSVNTDNAETTTTPRFGRIWWAIPMPARRTRHSNGLT